MRKWQTRCMKINKQTALLMGVVSLGNTVGWLASFSLGYNSLMIVWSVLVVSVLGISIVKIPNRTLRYPAWWVWGILSVVGIIINLLATKTPYLDGVAYSHWYALIGIGYLFSGIYNPNNPLLDKFDRFILVFSGLVCAGFTIGFFVYGRFLGLGGIIGYILVLTVVPTTILSIRFGLKSRE